RFFRRSVVERILQDLARLDDVSVGVPCVSAAADRADLELRRAERAHFFDDVQIAVAASAADRTDFAQQVLPPGFELALFLLRGRVSRGPVGRLLVLL